MGGKVGRVDRSGVSLVRRSDDSGELMNDPLVISRDILSAQSIYPAQ